MQGKKVAIIGAGITGLSCARRLLSHGFEVKIFEKSRGVSGRCATRRIQDFSFDHGAQYFLITDNDFKAFVDDLLKNKVVSEWEGPIQVLTNGAIRDTKTKVSRFVGVPSNSAIGKYLANPILQNISLNTLIDSVEHKDQMWNLKSSDKHLGTYDYLVVSAPAPQTFDLLSKSAQPVADEIKSQVKMLPCWSVLAAFSKPQNIPFVGAFVHDSALNWVARNSSKEGRSKSNDCWVLHATPEWSELHLEEDPKDIANALFSAFQLALGPDRKLDDPLVVVAHRWRFSITTQSLPKRFLYLPELKVGACGDWCGGQTIEAAFLSGWSLGDHIASLSKL
eukprot:TRINITY_DN13066_c0_g1_i1.p1 TRINITY_DN13066_c0_g1~~TRINITY_DN13066_c0_g1_i1.p1  ORF type:complete len:336 (+),score=60.99 TRINITY_DN13066_c0_g1_i1:103-1110(+)